MSASESEVICQVEQMLKAMDGEGLRLTDRHNLLIRNWIQIHKAAYAPYRQELPFT